MLLQKVDDQTVAILARRVTIVQEFHFQILYNLAFIDDQLGTLAPQTFTKNHTYVKKEEFSA